MSQNKPKFIFYIESNKLGGCEQAALSRAIGIGKLGIPTGIICSNRLELGAYEDEAHKLALGCIKLPLKYCREYFLKAFLPSLDFRQKNIIRETLVRIRPDALIVAQSGPDTCHTAILAAASLKIPVVADVAFLLDPKINPYKGGILRYLWIRKHYHLCKKLITNCRKNASILEELRCAKKDSVAVIYNGVEISKFPPAPNQQERSAARKVMDVNNDDWLIGVVGRLTVEKGHEWLMEAFGELLNIMPDSKLVIIGDGELLPKLRNKALIFKDRVKFMGWREDVSQLYWGMDVFVLPSIAESNSLAVLQAFSAKIPVVSTNVHGMPEIVRQNENGILIELRDNSGFVKAMSDIRQDTKKREGMIGSAFKFISEELEFDKQLTKYLECILRVIK